MDLQRVMPRIPEIRKDQLREEHAERVLVTRTCAQSCLPRCPDPHWTSREHALLTSPVAWMRNPKSSLEFMGSGSPKD